MKTVFHKQLWKTVLKLHTVLLTKALFENLLFVQNGIHMLENLSHFISKMHSSCFYCKVCYVFMNLRIKIVINVIVLQFLKPPKHTYLQISKQIRLINIWF